MAASMGIKGNLTAGTDSSYVYDLLTSGIAPFQAQVSIVRPTAQFSTYQASAKTALAGLGSWTINFSGYFPRTSAAMGLSGLVTFASGYVTNAKAWSLEIVWDEAPVTPFASTPPEWATYIVGQDYGWSGSYTGYIDTSSGLVLPDRVVGAATFKLLDNGEDDDDTLAGNIVAQQLDESIQVGQPNMYTYGFTGSGQVTAGGENALLPAGAIGEQAAAQPVTVTASTGRTFTGDAWLQRLGVSVDLEAANPITVTGTLRGTGTPTQA